jgi:sarcosine oxidase subunit delta
MRIDCPCCGPRDAGEFTLLGDAKPRRPEGMAARLEDMTEYVYMRDNPAGPHEELWYHGFGCRSWLVVTRDTRSHAISRVALARDVSRSRLSERLSS